MLGAVRDWHEDDDDMPFLAQGYAGTGKTYLAQHIAGEMGLGAAYLAPTGKATAVLRSKVADAHAITTIHGAIYAPVVKDPERYAELEQLCETETRRRLVEKYRREMRNLAQPGWSCRKGFVWQHENWEGQHGKPKGACKLIVVDEASMVGARVGEDLMKLARRHDLRVVAIGDFAQLPPIGDTAFFSEANCIAAPEMDEIVRQRAGSPILDLATHVRHGDRPIPGDHGDELRVYPTDWNDRIYDQIICGRNVTRHKINDSFRAAFGHSRKLPQPGEPMIVLRNNHGLKIVNGDVFRVVDCERADDGALWLRGQFDDSRAIWFAAVREEDGEPKNGETPVGYAYAITCHKAQGSEFDSVLVFDESRVFGRDASRWRYTAITRARQHLTLTR